MTALSSGSIIAPVPLSDRSAVGRQRSAGPAAKRRPLPLAAMAITPREGDVVYGLVTLDFSGRIADRALIAAMGWEPGTRLGIRETEGLVVVAADDHGVFTVTRQRYLQLPAVVRQWCDLRAGDRVLLAGYPSWGVLVVHPPASLDAMIAQTHGRVLGGDAA